MPTFLTLQPILMTIQEIATKLADYCRKGEWSKAQKELYANDAISVEPYETPDFPRGLYYNLRIYL